MLMKSVAGLFKYFQPYRLIVLLGPLFMCLEVGMDLIQPTIMQKIIDNGIASEDDGYVLMMGLFMFGAALLGLIGGIGSSIFSTRAAVHFATDLRKDVFRKIDYFSGPNMDKFGAGKLITIMTNDITAVQQAAMMTLRIFVRGPIMFIGSIVIVYLTARELFPILLVIVPILVVLIILFTIKAGSLFGLVQKAIDRVNTKTQEHLAGVRVVKAYGTEEYEMKQFSQVNESLTKVNIRADLTIMGLMPILQFIVNMGIVFAVWMGAIKLDGGSMEVGVIIAFVNYLTIILNSLMTSSSVLMQITRAFPSAGRIKDVLDTKEDMAEAEMPVSISRRKGEIEFKNVSFSYSRNGEHVLSNVSVHVKEGETLGIIGATGSGKSTFAKLIPRLYDVEEGQILLNGTDIRDLSFEELRDSIGFITQKNMLFSGAIRNNLKMGKGSASEEEMISALEDAQALPFVRNLDGMLDYELTQGATNLSGGQRQRLSIARALVRKPAVLVIDDATSAVDAISEANIQAALKKHYAESTKIIISSKISSVKEANQILVLDDGKEAGLGTHKELLESNELYQEICRIQGIKEGETYESARK